jgi:hypothetical protein
VVPVFGLDAAALATLPAFLVSLNAAIEKRDPALETLADFPLSVEDADGFFYGQTEAVQVKSFEALRAACKSYDKRRENADDYVPPKGCPHAEEIDTDDERGLFVDSIAPGVIELSFPSSREIVVTWLLAHKDGRWRLTAISSRS